MEKNEEPKIWVTISEKINIGNYESLEIQAGFSRIYSNKDDPKKLLDSEIDELQKLIRKKSKKIRKNRKT